MAFVLVTFMAHPFLPYTVTPLLSKRLDAPTLSFQDIVFPRLTNSPELLRYVLYLLCYI